jgi:hypothetical protein
MVDRLIACLDPHHSPYFNCFYLSWAKRTAEWCTAESWEGSPTEGRSTEGSPPEGSRPHGFTAVVWWDNLKSKITLASDIASAPAIAIKNVNVNINVEYLKSHLQKCIRKSNAYRAVKTATELINLDLSAFLRRILIIALEDALPLEGYSMLTWFMSAHSKGFQLHREHIDWLLGYVYDLAKCDSYEQINHTEEKLAIRNMRLHTLKKGAHLIYSILWRETYGGLKHDIILCRNVAILWTSRFQTDSVFLTLLERPCTMITPARDHLNRYDWYNSAIDFHTCPSMIQNIREKHDEYTETDIKMAIWHGSSAVTNKKNIGLDCNYRVTEGHHLDVWKAIQKSIWSYTNYVLNTHC